MIELITGHAGENHIDSEDVRAMNRGIFGTGNYVLEGSEEETILPAMTVRVPALELMLNGRHMRTDGTDTVNFMFTNQGTTRTDYICARYVNDGGIERAEIVVANESELQNSFNAVDYPLYMCVVSGSVMKSITCVLTKLKSIYSATRTLKVAEGGTGATNATEARKNIGVNAIYKVQSIKSGTFPIYASGTTSLNIDIPAQTGYKAVAIAGYNFTDGTPTTAYDHMSITKMYITGSTAKVRIYNNASKEGMGNLTLYILYIKEL